VDWENLTQKSGWEWDPIETKPSYNGHADKSDSDIKEASQKRNRKRTITMEHISIFTKGCPKKYFF